MVVLVPIANLSAVVTGAMATAMEMLPAALTRDAVAEATRASAAWFMHHLWTAWLAIARAFAAVDTLPSGAAAAAGSAVEASGPWVQAAARLLHGLYGWLVTAAVEKLPDVAAEKLLGDATAWHVQGHGGAAVYLALALVLLAAAFLGGAVCALTCWRTMKAPGLAGARVPRAVFEASPKRYYAAVRSAKKARRRGCGSACTLLSTGLLVAFLAYLVAKVTRHV